MKNFVLVAVICLTGFVSQAQAGEQVVVSQQKTVEFNCVRPVDVLKSATCYTLGVGKKVMKGAGQIITAPFKTRMCLPEVKRYRWERGHWIRGRWYEVPELQIEDGKPEASNMQYLPYHAPLRDDNFITVTVADF